ncbi:tetratricopeptide repeat protein, partial [Candidatus Sumerlaeota bacterium]|nr:tetratricopeptide repeat protein [Candidatus Sumerlaeota bacterium]
MKPTPPSTDVDRHSSELAAMRRMLAASEGTFSLGIAVCNSRSLQNHLIETLKKDRPGIAKLRVPPQTTDILAFAKTALDPKAPSPAALFLVELEESVPSGLEDYRVLRVLNASRERWRTAFSCPVVFWVPEYVAALVSARCPDFWSWKSHQFDFAVEPLSGASLATSHFSAGMSTSLSLDEKRLRLAELKQRVQEAGDPPARELADHVGEWLNEMGVIHCVLGEYRLSISVLERALGLWREIGDRWGEGAALGNLGNAYADLGDARKAIEFHEKALEIDREIGNRRGEGNALGNLGNAYAQLGDARKAIEFHEKALEIDREIGDRRGEGADLGNLGIAYRQLGDARRAIEFHEKALEIDR